MLYPTQYTSHLILSSADFLMVVVNGLKANQEERLVVLKTTYHQRVIRHCYSIFVLWILFDVSIWLIFGGSFYNFLYSFLQENWNCNILKNQHTSLINNYNNKNFIAILMYQNWWMMITVFIILQITIVTSDGGIKQKRFFTPHSRGIEARVSRIFLQYTSPNWFYYRKHYIEKQRREDGFDLSGPEKLCGEFTVFSGVCFSV